MVRLFQINYLFVQMEQCSKNNYTGKVVLIWIKDINKKFISQRSISVLIGLITQKQQTLKTQ